MANKATISKKFGEDVVVVVEAESAISAEQAVKDAVKAVQLVKIQEK